MFSYSTTKGACNVHVRHLRKAAFRVDLEHLYRVATFLAAHGQPKPAKTRITTWAILVAHASEPSDHMAAQTNAQKLIDAEGIDRTLKGNHPCLVLGVPAARRYFVDQGYLRTLEPFHPSCVTHHESYVDCSPACTYGIRLGGDWVHELVDSRSASGVRKGSSNVTKPSSQVVNRSVVAPGDAVPGSPPTCSTGPDSAREWKRRTASDVARRKEAC